MNDNQLNGKEIDIVYVDEIANITAVQEKVLSDMVDSMHYSLWGTITGRIQARMCSHCKKVHEKHPWIQEIYYDHPFFNNNLEYLEWEASKRGQP